MASPVTPGGNCGPGNTWLCQVVDNSADVGRYSSIALPIGLSFFGPGIAYFDATNGSLKFAERTCIIFPCKWNIWTVAAGGLGLTDGKFASFKYDSNGVAQIGYQVTTPSSAFLWYAHSLATTGGNCGVGTAAGKWQCDPLDSGPGLGQYVSLGLDGTRPYIAYYDGGNADLKLAFQPIQLDLPLILR